MTKHGNYSGVVYVNRFGSWNNATEEAELTPNSKTAPQYTDGELLNHLREFASKLETDSPSSKK